MTSATANFYSVISFSVAERGVRQNSFHMDTIHSEHENWHIRCLQDTLALAPRYTQHISLCLKPVLVQLFVQFGQIHQEMGTLHSVVIAPAACYHFSCLCSWGTHGISFPAVHEPGMEDGTEPLSDICAHWNLAKLEVNLEFEILTMRIFLSGFNKINWGELVLLWVVSVTFVCGPCPHRWCRCHWRIPYLQVSKWCN